MTPLAVFLMVAEEGAYFHWGTGPDVLPGPGMDVWRNDVYDEMIRPLGKPLGRATAEGSRYARKFERPDVRVDRVTRGTRFEGR